jgi:hypothetical protein
MSGKFGGRSPGHASGQAKKLSIRKLSIVQIHKVSYKVKKNKRHIQTIPAQVVYSVNTGKYSEMS